MFKKPLLLAALLCFSITVSAQESQLAADHPDRYVVQEGDTLWDISALFLNDAWLWPEIWYANPQIQNPHLIYPGDVISLVYVGGEPRLVLERGGPQSLGPRVRATPHEKAIDALPVAAIRPFLNKAVVLDEDTIEGLPYIVANEELRLVVGEHGTSYVRRLDAPAGTRVAIARTGHVYHAVEEPPPAVQATRWEFGGGTTVSGAVESAWDTVIFWDDGEVLGYELVTVAEGVVTRPGDPAVVEITRSHQEVQRGDVVLVQPVEPYDARFVPHPHDDPAFNARIIALSNSYFGAGQYQVVALDQGAVDGVEAGHVFAVLRPGPTIRDEVMYPSGDLEAMLWLEDPDVTLPTETIGHLMVFRTFEQVSYGLVMEATSPVHIYDVAVNPDQ